LASQDDIDSVSIKLQELSEKVSETLESSQFDECDQSLRQYFSIIRYGHADGLISDEDLSQHVRSWKDGVMRLSNISPYLAFGVSCAARDICSRGEKGLACDLLIVNTACVCINVLAGAAFKEHQRSVKNFPIDKFTQYIKPVIDVMTVTSAYFHSQNMQNTFYESLTVFENMLYSHMVPPVSRYSVVTKIRDWAEAQKPNCGALFSRMEEILEEATFLPNGQGIIPHPMEIYADYLAAEHYLSVVNEAIQEEIKNDQEKEKQRKKMSGDGNTAKIISFSSAAAFRVGVSPDYASLYQKIEKSLDGGQFQAAENRLFALFHRLAEDDQDENGDDVSEDTSTYSYLLKTVERLSKKSLTHGFHLASRCIIAIEEELHFSDKLQEEFYSFATPVIGQWQMQNGGHFHATKELNKAIMKRSSEFLESEQADDIFENAAAGYREYLGSLHPTQRYDELFELSLWLRDRKYPSPLMENFVDGLMNSAQKYGNFMGIPLEEDEVNRMYVVPGHAP
jgi:hypothetical protein